MGNITSNKTQPDNEYDNIFGLYLDKMEKGTLNYKPEIIPSDLINIKCNSCNINLEYICKNKWTYHKTNTICDFCNNLNNMTMYSSV